MTFPLPAGVINTDSAYYYADDTFTWTPLFKQPADQTLIVVDYGEITPAIVIETFSFAVDTTSNPQLVVSYPSLDPTGTVLSFLVSGGVAGVEYFLTVTVTFTGGTRADTLAIDVPSSCDCACDMITPVPAIYTQLPLGVPTQGYINTAIRYFWGPAAPSNPNVLDQWYNSTTLTLYEWATDGTNFFWQVVASPNFVEDAPADGVLYSRYNGVWTPDAIQTDAPDTGQYFVRYDNSWVVMPPTLADAPADGNLYARQNRTWQPAYSASNPSNYQTGAQVTVMLLPYALTSELPAGSNAQPLMDGGATPGVGAEWSRFDHVHPVDISRYAADNPAGYITLADLPGMTGPVPTLITPLMNGVAALGTDTGYTRGDHVHPTDITRYAANNPSGYQNAAQVAAAISASAYVLPTASTTLLGGVRVDGTSITIAGGVISSSGGGGGGIPDAPANGSTYGRNNNAWVVVSAGGGGIPDAPVDGTAYARKSAAWANITHNDITDWAATLAPYALITSIPAASNALPLINGASAAGVATAWSRADHIHPIDTSRYAATNPSGYQTAAQVATALVPYALASAVPVPSLITPLINGVPALGADTGFARGDHIHPTDTSRYAATNPSGYQTAAQVTTALAPYALTSAVPAGSNSAPLMDGTAAAGVGPTWARADHVHPSDTTGNVMIDCGTF
jgi:hypothetical protein